MLEDLLSSSYHDLCHVPVFEVGRLVLGGVQ